jgi:hypothetical protein
MKQWICGTLVMLCAAAVTPSFAADAGDASAEKRPRVELSLRSWMFTNGETTWSHNASGLDSRLGNPTSKLTYKDNDTQIVELSGKINVSRRWFVRGDVGFSVDFDRGTLIDDDYSSVGGQHLASRTQSNISGHGTWYLNADVGLKALQYPGNRGSLDVFWGYQYWKTKYTADGVTQLVCAPSGAINCNFAGLPQNAPVIENTTQWHSLRMGAQTEYRLTSRLSLLGKAAFSPISVVLNDDIHKQRADLQQNPSFSMRGIGVGANVDAALRVMIARGWFFDAGYRLFWNRTYTGTWETHPIGAATQSAPLTEFQTFRHGATIALTATF